MLFKKQLAAHSASCCATRVALFTSEWPCHCCCVFGIVPHGFHPLTRPQAKHTVKPKGRETPSADHRLSIKLVQGLEREAQHSIHLVVEDCICKQCRHHLHNEQTTTLMGEPEAGPPIDVNVCVSYAEDNIYFPKWLHTVTKQPMLKSLGSLSSFLQWALLEPVLWNYNLECLAIIMSAQKSVKVCLITSMRTF